MMEGSKGLAFISEATKGGKRGFIFLVSFYVYCRRFDSSSPIKKSNGKKSRVVKGSGEEPSRTESNSQFCNMVDYWCGCLGIDEYFSSY